MCIIRVEKLKMILLKSLKDLFENDAFLIKNSLKEESINHKFSNYLEKNFLSKYADDDLVVDVEYNKSIDKQNIYNQKKKITDHNNSSKSIIPDILIHKRGNNEKNIIVFECKKKYKTKKDKIKIIELLKEPYNYTFGCIVRYDPIFIEIYNKTSLKENEEMIDKIDEQECEEFIKNKTRILCE